MQRGNKDRMQRVGIFFGSLSGNTRIVAEIIKKKLPDEQADLYDIFETNHSKITSYKNLIFGVPTWGKLILHDDWQLFLENLGKFNLKQKKIALFGLGDQVMFSDAFADAMGVVYDKLNSLGCDIIGGWPVDGYEFEASYAKRNNDFCGLVIDEENQSYLTEQRVEEWISYLHNDFH